MTSVEIYVDLVDLDLSEEQLQELTAALHEAVQARVLNHPGIASDNVLVCAVVQRTLEVGC